MTWVSLIRVLTDLVGSVVLIAYVLAGLWTLRRRDLVGAQLQVADGILFALTFKTAATLLRTSELSTWPQIGMFVAIFALRQVLGRVIRAERRALRH